MSRNAPTFLVAAVLTAVIALLSGGGWPTVVFGAIYALALWLILYLGVAGKDPGHSQIPPWSTYVVGAVLAVVVGYALYRNGDRDGSWWGVGVILAGFLAPEVHTRSRSLASRRDE